jgi:hypothetical protein
VLQRSVAEVVGGVGKRTGAGVRWGEATRGRADDEGKDIGVENSAQQFGRIVCQTEIGEVFSLDLFETPDLVCRGFYLPAPALVREGRRLPERSPPPTPEVELRASRGAMQELERSSDIRSDDDQNRRYFEVYGTRFETYGTFDLVSRRQRTEVWSGSIEGGGMTRMSFVLERYGSPEIILLIAAIWLLIYRDRRADDLDDECWAKAVEMCGERRIKRYKVRRGLMSLDDPQGFSHDCKIECM